MLKDDLDIILITYNRKNHLRHTLDNLLGAASPIRNFGITILDNKSTDGTSEMIGEYAAKHPNIKHIRHNRNIGGVANSIRAYEIAKKKYVWVLCDDDSYDWSNWGAVEAAVMRDEDVICVSRYVIPDEGMNRDEYTILQLTFLPAGIYKTDLITQESLRNAYNNLQTLLPQVCFSVEIFNSGKKVFILDKPIVLRNQEDQPRADETHNRGDNIGKLVHKTQKMSWIVGYATVCANFKDQDLKHRTMLHAINRPEVHNGFDNFADFMATNYPMRECWDMVLTVFLQLDEVSQRRLLKRFIELQTNFTTDAGRVYDYFLNFSPDYAKLFTLPNGSSLSSRKVYSLTLDDGTLRTISVFDTPPVKQEAQAS